MGWIGVGVWASALAAGSLAMAGEIAPDDVVFTGDMTVETPLTDGRPDPFRGLEVFIDRRLGNCVACHVNFDVEAMQFLGDIGPELNWVGERLSPAQIRAILVNPKMVYGPDTIMPAFYRVSGFTRPRPDVAGKPILTAQQIEDVVAYLSELRRR